MAAKKKGKLGAGGASAKARPEQNLLYSASQIWSAGLGAMARAQGGGGKFFEDLVREGMKLQGGAIDSAVKGVRQAIEGAQKQVHQRVGGVRGQATETWDNLEKIFQSRVQRALHQLGMPTAEEIGALTRKVDQLAQAVEQLAKASKQGKTRTKAKPGAKRPARRKPARTAAIPPVGT